MLSPKTPRIVECCPFICGDFLGVRFFPDGTRLYTDLWFCHLETLSEDFQVFLLERYAHDQLNPLSAIKNRLSPTVLDRARNAFNWTDIIIVFDPVDPERLWSAIPLFKELWTGSLYQHLYFIYQPYFQCTLSAVTRPAQYYLPLLLRLCTCPDDAVVFFKRYKGGLTDESFDQLIAVMPSEVVEDCLNRHNAKAFQIARLADRRKQKSLDHWLFCFEVAADHRTPLEGDALHALVYLLQKRRLFTALSHHNAQHARSRFAEDKQLLGHYEAGELTIGYFNLKATFTEIYENLLKLLPTSQNPRHQAILWYIRYGKPLPSILRTPEGTPEEFYEAQKQALHEYLSQE
jgi:hypothetical protein